jgi:hypothetical protein
MRHTLLAPGQLYGSPIGEYQYSCRMLRRVTQTPFIAGPLGGIASKIFLIVQKWSAHSQCCLSLQKIKLT